MNERELSLIKALGEEFSAALQDIKSDFEQQIKYQKSELVKQIEELRQSITEIKPAEYPDIVPLVDDAVKQAVKSIPVPKDGKSVTAEDLVPLIKEIVQKSLPDPIDVGLLIENVVSKIPTPQVPVLPDINLMVNAAVDDAVKQAVKSIPVPKDGKSVTAEDLRPLVEQVVSSSLPEPVDVKALVGDVLAKIPPPEHGNDGRDALAIELQPCIDEKKSYPRGTYATHNGGLWRAHEKTHGMRGWECIVDGVSDVDIQQQQQRSFTITLKKASGISESKSFEVPIIIYRDVFKSGNEYHPGDTVTWGGSLWHCNEITTDKPGESASKCWTLAVKKGRDLRDK